jgi:endonuclease/exonuclease/phosphatase family metal-dependent hydrolase
MDRQRSEDRIAEVIASLKVDVVGLQELDLGRARSGRVDQAKLIAKRVGWNCIFQPAMRRGDEQYGDAILSRLPLRLHRGALLPGMGSWYCRETRVAIWAEVESEIGRVQIINTHLGLGRSERLTQAQMLISDEWLGGSSAAMPLILLGDFNSLPRGRTYRSLTSRLRDVRALLPSAGTCRTFPTRLASLAVDHIFVNAALEPVSLVVYRDDLARVASDHFPLVGEFRLQKSGGNLSIAAAH